MGKALTPDICVIGAGPGGLAVATGAAAYGVKVVLVDRLVPGGNTGRSALPGTALAAAARQAMAVRGGARFGMSGFEPDVDFQRVMAEIGKVAAPTHAISPERLSTLGVTFIQAEARFLNRRRLQAGDTEIRARRYVLATGSRPIVPAIAGLEDTAGVNSDTFLEMDRAPSHLIVVGGDGAALELAQCFRRLGSKVTLLAEGNVLPEDDPEMASVIVRRLRAEGIAINEGVKVTAAERRGKTWVRVSTENAAGTADVDGDELLFSLGRTPDVEALDLRRARVALKGDAVDVSEMLRTTNRRVYAIGDVAGAWSVQAARHQAELVLKALLFRLPAKDRAAVPRVVNTDPGLAHVGLTEAEASRRHKRLTILRSPYSENDGARAMRKTEGHIKLVVARDGKVLGVTVAGANAAEMIGMWTLALANSLSLRDIAASPIPHCTMAEIGKTAAMSYFPGRAHRPLARGMARLLQFFG